MNIPIPQWTWRLSPSSSKVPPWSRCAARWMPWTSCTTWRCGWCPPSCSALDGRVQRQNMGMFNKKWGWKVTFTSKILRFSMVWSSKSGKYRKRCVSWLDGIKNLEITSPMGSAYCTLWSWTTPNKRWGLQQILSNKDGMLTRKRLKHEDVVFKIWRLIFGSCGNQTWEQPRSLEKTWIYVWMDFQGWIYQCHHVWLQTVKTLIGAKTAAWTFIFEDWVRKSGLYNRLPKPGTLILHEFSGLNTFMQNKNIDRT